MRMLCFALLLLASSSSLAQDSLIRVNVFNYSPVGGYTRDIVTKALYEAQNTSKKTISADDLATIKGIISRAHRREKSADKLGSPAKAICEFIFSSSGAHNIYLSDKLILDDTADKYYWIDVLGDQKWLRAFIGRTKETQYIE